MPPRAIKVEEFLRNLPIFRDLSAEEVGRIAAATSQVRASAASILFRKGDPCAGFHVIVYGQVKLAFGASDGSEKVVEILGPGQSFGEAVMFLDKPYVVFAETLADSLLLHVGKAAIFQELEHSQHFARRMLGGLAQRLHRIVGDLEGYSLKSGTQRVIGYLLRDVAAEGRTAEVTLPASKSVIASRLSITREHFSRILHELSDSGLIKVRGRDIRFLDIERLRNFRG
ncbi:MAG: Crp/Fnr family transcriptional regulator [Betaproteobacteria bacterium RIFCSPLOWO2_12_FULL_65_110]|nr:MAG: Crp/Fnr family transcriptional regulator [Betaproteobacteria bacterium RIFCSPLOWO2_12_FULL_65_110]